MLDLFKQCALSRSQDDGVARMISWIPAHLAIAGSIVALKDSETGEQTSNWRVDSVGESGVSAKLLERQSRDYLRTRNASDI